MRIETATNRVYILEVNPFLYIFYPIGNTSGDNLVVRLLFADPLFKYRYLYLVLYYLFLDLA